MKVEIRGCGTAIVTPFDERGRIDFSALSKLVDWQISEGIDFLATSTPEGESPSLSGEERRAVTAHVVQVSNGRVPVVAGAGGNHTAKSVFWARDAERAGAAALLAVSPFYNLPSPEGICRHFAAIGDATRLPLIVWNSPARTGHDLDVETTLRLLEIPHVAALCEGSADFRKIAGILSRAPAGFSIFSGDDATVLAGLGMGMQGLFSTISNLVPGAMSQLLDAADEGRFDEARAGHRRLLPLIELSRAESSPAPVKALLAMMGRCGETLRLPLVPVREDTRRTLEKAARSWKFLPKGARAGR